jgi:predicted amidohydrolase YtcJ
MIDAGISTCFGSDFPIVPCNPFAAIKSAVTRIVDSAENAVIEPRECITLEQALYAYTIDAAYAEFSEQSKGSLAPGKFADFLILDRNPFETPAKELDTITVANTVFDGKIY